MNRKQLWIVMCSVLSVAALMPRANAATWRVIDVAQPLLVEVGIEIRDVPYSVDRFVPGEEVALTCESNAIRNIGEDFETQTADRNTASQFGLTMKVSDAWDGKAPFDTLVVTVDAARAARKAKAEGFASLADSIVEATILCVRINAARSLIPNKYVTVRVLGLTRAYKGRVFAVAGVVPPKRSFDFGPSKE